MKANVYVDGFNFYYGAVKGTPYKWLDIALMCRMLLPSDTVHRIKYFTAPVHPRPKDPDQRLRQETYFRALSMAGAQQRRVLVRHAEGQRLRRDSGQGQSLIEGRTSAQSIMWDAC